MGDPAFEVTAAADAAAAAAAPAAAAAAHADHAEKATAALEEEFGALDGVVRFHDRSDSEDSEVQARHAHDKAGGGRGGRFSRAQWLRLGDLLWHRRWLRQYFSEEGVLVREHHRRPSMEELFLDLIIVAALASLSHELRHSFDGWPSVEEFILLFGALYSSWRTVIYMWNAFGSKGDLLDKVGIFLTLTSIAGIGLGAHSAFGDARVPVAVASFVATMFPAVSLALMSWMEPIARNDHNRWHQGLWHGIVNVVTVLPYLAAAFVDSERAAKTCYWVGLVATQLSTMCYVFIYLVAHRNRPKAVRYAMNLEGLVEKYGTLVLIVLGESLMAMLFEGSELLAQDDVRVGALFYATFLGVLIVYSIQTLYFNVDNFVVKGAVHPIRHNKWNGMTWGWIHFFYYMALGGFLSTGIGLMLRDIAVLPNEASLELNAATDATDHMLSAVVHASEASAGTVQFDKKARWLFSGSWMAVIIISSVMGLLYKAGPRGRTKNYRLIFRIVVVLALGLGMPNVDVSAMTNLSVFAYVSLFFALLEFVCIQMDRIGMLSWSGKSMGSTLSGSSVGVGASSGDSEFDSESDDMDDVEEGKRYGASGASASTGEDNVDEATALARRKAGDRQRRHKKRFEVVSHPVLAFRNAAHHHG